MITKEFKTIDSGWLSADSYWCPIHTVDEGGENE